MAIATYSRPEPAEPRDATAFNTILSGFQTESTNLDEENFAPEGLDHAVFSADNIHAERIEGSVGGLLEADARSTLLGATYSVAGPTTIGQTVAFGGTTFQTGAITIPANAICRVFAQIFFDTDATLDGIPSGLQVQLGFSYQPNAGAETALAHSLRRHTAGVDVQTQHGCITVMGYLTNSEAGTGDVVDFVRLRMLVSAATDTQVRVGQMYTTVYYKAV